MDKVKSSGSSGNCSRTSLTWSAHSRAKVKPEETPIWDSVLIYPPGSEWQTQSPKPIWWTKQTWYSGEEKPGQVTAAFLEGKHTQTAGSFRLVFGVQRHLRRRLPNSHCGGFLGANTIAELRGWTPFIGLQIKALLSRLTLPDGDEFPADSIKIALDDQGE